MSKYVFLNEQRLAIYTVHREKCYICTKRIPFSSTEIDHVIPESLGEDPLRLAEVLAAFGLPPEFDLNSFDNWLPACRPCNQKKGAQIFRPTLLSQSALDTARDKASKVAAKSREHITTHAISKAIAILEVAGKDNLADSQKEALKVLLAQADTTAEVLTTALTQIVRSREPEMSNEPLNLTPQISIISENDGVRIVRGPYGVGVSPMDPTGNFRCGTCGQSAWNGARCVFCGQLDDE